VPTLVAYSGVLKNTSGSAPSTITGITFLLYKDEQGGAPLWLETQNVTPDKAGHYTVQLGAASASGLPSDLFKTGEARWLAVQPQGQVELPRVLLVAVPYAMKAADAETVGGLPASAFVLAAPPVSGIASAPGTAEATASPSASALPPATSNVTTTGGTANKIPLFTTATNVQNSILTQTGTTAITVAGKLNLPATGTATATAGKPSQPEAFVASTYNSGTATVVPQTFQLKAEPAGNNTAATSATMNLLYGSGTATPAETGFKINSKGVVTFAIGQTFPGTGPGTVKSVGLTAPASDFTVSGSPVTGTGTLGLNWTVPPTNANTANAIVKRDASGNFSTNVISANTVSVNLPGDNATGIDVNAPGVSVDAIYADASASSGANMGVVGITQSGDVGAIGVLGSAISSSGSAIGVEGYGFSATSVAILGVQYSGSTTGQGLFSLGKVGNGGAGAWGDSSGSSGVVGTADDASGGVFANNSGTYWTVNAINENAKGYPFQALNSANNTGCYIDETGSIYCSGSKNAVVPVDGGQHTVALSAIESPKNWFEDFGSAELVGGSAKVALDSTFTQTVNTELEYQVFLTPYGDCKGLYVTNRTATSFEVHELGGGAASLSFGYRITALRKNFESIRFSDQTKARDIQTRMIQGLHAGSAKPMSHTPIMKNISIMHPQLAPGR
jgi:hypothetical protein